ncbi:MAG: pyridoxal 5'-phosphate synthase glutaminase subunit PdxT [Chloroflexaceae bacterium]|nr:pyridoxal 5'-phosphate synthase glutaminase subunit PdxT [Chloroflexaceae bacterium]
MTQTVGILSLQGDFAEHEAMLRRIGVATRQVRLPEDLTGVDRLIMPGGESTTIGKLLHRYDLLRPIQQRSAEGMPLWGTCAGAILLARTIQDGVPDQPALHLMDITVRRNGYGRQTDSFEADLALPMLGAPPLRGIFIRAPVIVAADPHVEILADLGAHGGIVAARQGTMLATTFHPELTPDDRLHRYFLEF